jgi:hypothetical protein
MFQHNSGTPGAISTKLGTHMTIFYTYKNGYTYSKKKLCSCP